MYKAESIELQQQMCLYFIWKTMGKRAFNFFFPSYSFLFIFIHNCLTKDLNNNLCLHGSFWLSPRDFIYLLIRCILLNLFCVPSTGKWGGGRDSYKFNQVTDIQLDTIKYLPHTLR